MLYPINLILLPLMGNTLFVGNNFNMSGLRIFALYYREWALGVSNITNNLTIGMYVKWLFGKENLHISNSGFYLYTNSDIYRLSISNIIQMNTSSIDVNVTNNRQIPTIQVPPELGVTQFLLNSRNKGVSFYFGCKIYHNNTLTLSMSILDLGFIFWRAYSMQNEYNYQFHYDGFHYDPITRQYEDIQQVIDSF